MFLVVAYFFWKVGRWSGHWLWTCVFCSRHLAANGVGPWSLFLIFKPPLFTWFGFSGVCCCLCFAFSASAGGCDYCNVSACFASLLFRWLLVLMPGCWLRLLCFFRLHITNCISLFYQPTAVATSTCLISRIGDRYTMAVLMREAFPALSTWSHARRYSCERNTCV